MIRFFKEFIIKIKARETDPINQARALMLCYLLLAHCVFAVFLIGAYAYTHQIPQLIRAGLILFFSVSLLTILYYFNAWRILSHTVLLLITVVAVWANLLFFVKGVNAATLQFIWLASALGFYMHGLRWGWFYAIINILPVIIDAGFSGRDYFFLSSGPQIVARPIYVFVLVFDFCAIAFLHYFFFRAFNRNIITLTETKNQLNQINERLSLTVEEIKGLSKSRMDFLSTMSHELRTPLSGVIGLTDVLLHQQPRKDQEETLALLKFSTQNLLTLVNDVLDFNKLDSNMVGLERTAFNLSNLMSNIYGATKIKAEEKQLDFKLKIADELRGVILIGDPTRLTQVLLNLLNNAVKFTEKGGVTLACLIESIDETEVRIRFVVEDTGIGIEKGKQEEIFDEFVQASVSINRDYGGTGLGLPIVKKVLQLYNSKIEVESSIEKGAKFSFDIVFPYEKKSIDHAENDNSKQEISSDLSKLRVLVVEDNAVNIMVIKKTLNRFDINPDVAEDGNKAFEMVKANDYDLVLMDLYMPELDGYEATRLIRNLDDAIKSRLPIIALTATVNNQVLEEVLAVGMNGYLSKPFHPNDLFEELRKYVKFN